MIKTWKVRKCLATLVVPANGLRWLNFLFCFFKVSCMLVFRPAPVPFHTIYPSPANASVGFGWLSAWSEVKIWNIYPYWGMIIEPLSFLYPQFNSIYIPSISLTRRFECDIWISRRLLNPMSIKKTTMFIIWLVVSNMICIFHFIKKGCHPSHWRTPSFFRGVGQPPTSIYIYVYVYIYILIVILHMIGDFSKNHWDGLRETLQGDPIFDGKNHIFRWRFSRENQSSDIIYSMAIPGSNRWRYRFHIEGLFFRPKFQGMSPQFIWPIYGTNVPPF